ncbi:MAG: mechanosensitive ion channel family protein [Oscillospiraceae bacterium]|nr:mechanosensitive ion channel family protein [Oscillospiraceae bacterium]MBR0063752.1 mechanosensitive ion channel family protein [Oscillospiraceae bacterium]
MDNLLNNNIDFSELFDKKIAGNFTFGTILSLLVIIIVGYIIKQIVKRIVVHILDKTPRIAPSVKSFINSAVNIVLWTFIVLVAAEHIGIPVTSLVAAVSVVGVALSLSLQNTLTNVFAGMTILITKPVEVGDYVETDSIAGTVRRITLFHTVLETPGGAAVYLPNSNVTAAKVVNYSDMPVRRLEIEVTASYDDEPKKVIETLKMAARTTDLVLEDREPVAYVTGYGNSSIGYMLFAWCENKNFLAAKYALTERVFYAFKEEGVTMTYDHLNVHLDK